MLNTVQLTALRAYIDADQVLSAVPDTLDGSIGYLDVYNARRL